MKLYRAVFITLIVFLTLPVSSNADQLEDANAAIKNEDYKKASELLLPLAEENNTEAQSLLGSLYVNGQGVEKDFDKGMAFIMKAAKQGSTPARIQAFSLYIDLAKQGVTGAMYNVGYMCLNGWGGGEYDTETCMKWMEKAGKMGHEKSAKILARIYKEGMFGVTPDEEKANYWNNLHAAFASGIDGRWRGSVVPLGGSKPIYVVFEIEKDNDKLKGTFSTEDGFYNKNPINDGKIDGNNFSFYLNTKIRGRKITDEITGTFLGDTIQVTIVSTDDSGKKTPPISFTVKRAE
jgi:hypothetical protein